MSETKSGATKGFPANFYVANTMEIFERIAWYGFFTVSSLYMSSSPASGGLGFSDQERGVLQGLIPFCVYILPVFTGALGDRVGYKKMFLLAFAILTPGYFMLGQVSNYWLFFLFYLLVAVGAAIFKPLVVGTVARSANDENRGVAFGVFFMMVNIGGFIGPMIAGYVRAISWDMVFVLSASAIAVNLLIAFFFYDESQDPRATGDASEALTDVQEVLGNARFALLIAPIILALMIAGGGWISYQLFVILAGGWVVLHLIWDQIGTQSDSTHWTRQKAKPGNGPFLIYLLILSLFWACYNQIFVTLPLYLRDFVDTGDLVALAHGVSPALASFLAPVNTDNLANALTTISLTQLDSSTVRQLAEFQVRVPLDVLRDGMAALNAGDVTAANLARDWANTYRQVSPEYIIAFDFLSIVIFQYFVSHILQGRSPIGVLITGTLIITAAYLIGGQAHTVSMAGLLAIGSVIVFAFGEMIASPKSQEYVASFAPKEKSALFMGYYFVSMALGFLFAGLISGWAYDFFIQDLNQPGLMWASFAALGGLCAVCLFIFDRTLAHKMTAETSPEATDGSA